MAINKALYENFASFFENPTREGLRKLLQSNIGETNNIDFKETLPEKDKLAKHLLAMANSDGGIIIIGVSDDTPPIAKGISEKCDKSDIQKRVAPYIPKSLQFEVLDFSYSDSEYGAIKGKSFQAIIVESDPKYIPYLCIKKGENIKDNVVYIRRGTNSDEATHEELQKIINKRIETGYSSSTLLSLEEHFEQLKFLYKNIAPSNRVFYNFDLTGLFGKQEPNSHYPDESLDEFISKLIVEKKSKIRKVLEIDN